MKPILKLPFPYFGCKAGIAATVWERFGDVPNYVEPFCGSCAVLFRRPTPPRLETVNDADGLLCNFWRALQAVPDEVAHYADWPVNECDLHARHIWLVGQKDSLQARLEGDAESYDAKIAGWWVWGISCWIGSGWCSGNGPWRSVDGELVREPGNAGRGVNRRLPHLGDAGRGVNRQLPHLGNAGRGVNRRLPHLGDAGRGVNRQLPHLGGAGRGVNRRLPHLGDAGRGVNRQSYMRSLAERLRYVRVCCGDWSRIMGPTPTVQQGVTAVFLDPPYSAEAGRDNNVYRVEDDSVAHDVRKWALANGDNRLLRIALCGYEGEHDMPLGWECVAWKTRGGFGNQGSGAGRANSTRERVWFSPHCLNAGVGSQTVMFQKQG